MGELVGSGVCSSRAFSPEPRFSLTGSGAGVGFSVLERSASGVRVRDVVLGCRFSFFGFGRRGCPCLHVDHSGYGSYTQTAGARQHSMGPRQPCGKGLSGAECIRPPAGERARERERERQRQSITSREK